MMHKKLIYLPAIALLLAGPYFLYPVLLMKLMCFALFACAFNLLVGFTGLLSFGHAAFFGGAAYLAGYAVRTLHVAPEAGILIGAVAGGLLGGVMGALAIRRTGIYFTMITMALAQMLYFGFLQAPFTGGEDGLQGVPRGRLLGVVDLSDDIAMYYLVLAVAAGGIGLIVRTVRSPFGQVLHAIKQNEARAVSLGYDVAHHKLLAFVLSAALSGVAGATKTLVLGFATLSDVHWAMSGLVLLMTLVGGLGTLAGPVVGALIIVALENKLGDWSEALALLTRVDWFRSMGESVTTVTGLIFIACVLAFRRGIVGELAARWRT
jgi:branched-chain amino acid transport system permease protein